MYIYIWYHLCVNETSSRDCRSIKAKAPSSKGSCAGKKAGGKGKDKKEKKEKRSKGASKAKGKQD